MLVREVRGLTKFRSRTMLCKEEFHRTMRSPATAWSLPVGERRRHSSHTDGDGMRTEPTKNQMHCVDSTGSSRDGSREGRFLDTQGYRGVWFQNSSEAFRVCQRIVALLADSFPMRMYFERAVLPLPPGSTVSCSAGCSGRSARLPGRLREFQGHRRLCACFDESTGLYNGGDLLRPRKACSQPSP